MLALPAQDKCVTHGVSLALLRLWLDASPASAVDFFNELASSSPALAEWEVGGHVLGKHSSVTAAADTRAILPLPAVLMLVDTALSRRWNAWIDAQLPQPHGVHVGARPASQSLHIAHALHLVLERGLDSDNGTAVGQSDIRSYFDALPVLRIAEWMMDRGALPADVATLV